MTQEQKTEAVLDAAMCKSYRVGGAIAEIEVVTAHARDLARKLDALRGMIEADAKDVRSTEYSKEELIEVIQGLVVQARAIVEGHPPHD